MLGINWKLHDTAAALVDGEGKVWALAEEERFTRVKHAWDSYPRNAARFCLSTAGIDWQDLDVVAIGWDLPKWGVWGENDKEQLYRSLFGPEAVGHPDAPELSFVEHHLAHAYSAFYASGFKQAGVLVTDGAGEQESISIYSADAGGLKLKRRWPRGYSLGSMYEAATRLLGFGYLDAGKTMGLAPYGMAEASALLPFGDVVGDETGNLHTPFGLVPESTYPEVTEAWRKHLAARFGTVTHEGDQLHTDPVAVQIAASVQRTVEETIRHLHAETVSLTGVPEVCISGGVALNCVANGRLPEPLYVPPFPHDSGVALGAAWSESPPAPGKLLDSPYLGRAIVPGRELDELREDGFLVTDFDPSKTADLLTAGSIGAVAEGRSEVGPRALCHRSIMAMPHSTSVRDTINRIKGREMWRPLAPVTLPEYARRLWPDQGRRELYMVGNTVISAHAQEVMPASAHVDGTTRPQVLPPGQAPVAESLLTEFAARGLPPVLVNTSFNGRGEPIVDTAGDAVRAFRALGLDFLVLGEHLVHSPTRSAPSQAE
ncbi:carbamoyltransferase C-terminal domain-containing protein [Streptomyces sp. NPDC088789]|uniref:carbamoyltransferase C-terminal domain-containing protein n=1 Tax=Streptomyces sp. NPDC088789 TaxID=3365899 RepID=UPI0038085F5E